MKPIRNSPLAWLFATGLLASTASRAQNAPPSPAPPSAPSGNSPKEAEDVQLKPFEVHEGADNGYAALNSNSITRFNTELNRLPISADIFDQTFMNDTATTSVESLVETYSAGTGFTTSDPTNSTGNNQPGDRSSLGSFTLRGLATPQSPPSQRDGFMPTLTIANGLTSTFDIDRVEIINGPQSLLYGNGGAGGVLNIVSKQARLGAPTFGSTSIQFDQYGSKLATLDYGTGTENLAFRFSLLNQVQDLRRVNTGYQDEGYYGQLAWHFWNTTIRINSEQTTSYRVIPGNMSITSPTTGSPYSQYNGDSLRYLEATGQLGALTGLNLNSGNIDSLFGRWNWETRVNELSEINIDSRWNSWLSTQISAGYNDETDDVSNSITWTLYSPDDTSKSPLPGLWAMQMSGDEGGQLSEPSRTKALRGSALATNDFDFLGHKVHSQTIVGADFNRTDQATILERYYEADSNFNLLPARTTMPVQSWPVNNGPVLNALGAQPGSPQFTLGGINEVLAQTNPVNTALVSPSNPLGVSSIGALTYSNLHDLNAGAYGVKYTQWGDGRLDTIAGFRYVRAYEVTQTQGSKPPAPINATLLSSAKNLSFDVGADIRLNDWLRPYASVSDSYQPPYQAFDPYGNPLKTAHGIGEEAGLKLADKTGSLSGSLALYHVSSTNEEFSVSATLLNDINPSGLNGRFGSASSLINVDRKSQGGQAVLTAAPTPAWRLRFSAAVVNGTVKNSSSYAQVYNDQFNQNSQGLVTYADGTVVYVPAAFNSKTLTVPSTTAGAIPLTTALLSTPSSQYYAQPQPVNGQILSTSSGGLVLLNGATAATGVSAHGPILTGATGLPISQYQLSPALSGVTPPASIQTTVAGEATVGYPELSANFTSVYTIPSGTFKGFKFGGTAADGWKYVSYYFYPEGIFPGAPREGFSQPSLTRFDLILGYERRFRRVTFSTQLNVNNVFNHYAVILLPIVSTGWTTPVGINATYSQPPRMFLWTSTLSF